MNKPTIDDFIAVVQKHTGLLEIFQQSQLDKHVKARRMVMYVEYYAFAKSGATVGFRYSKGHSNVSTALKVYREELSINGALRDELGRALLDTGFSTADAHRLVSDPDYYRQTVNGRERATA